MEKREKICRTIYRLERTEHSIKNKLRKDPYAFELFVEKARWEESFRLRNNYVVTNAYHTERFVEENLPPESEARIGFFDPPTTFDDQIKYCKTPILEERDDKYFDFFGYWEDRIPVAEE